MPIRSGKRQPPSREAQYALEVYVPRCGSERLPEAAARAAAAAEQVSRQGAPVRFLRSIFMPGDELGFLLFETTSRQTVAEVAHRAAITFERVLRVELGEAERVLGRAATASPRIPAPIDGIPSDSRADGPVHSDRR